MQLLGQDVAVGDVIVFPAKRGEPAPVKAEIIKLVGLRAYDANGHMRYLPYDDHVMVYTATTGRQE